MELGETAVDHVSDSSLQPMGIDQLFEEASARIRRYLPAEALEAARHGALIVDIRSLDSRQRAGVIPGAVHVPRTVLEWRVASVEWKNPALEGARLILVCDHGYSSVLAAATLVELGCDCGDIVGGFEAWVAAGLPTKPAGPAQEGLPGMGPPD
jgi:rhodanese-related sulfurtransferase